MNVDDSGAAAAGQLGGGTALLIAVIALAFAAVMIASMWKIFSKAGQPGWASLVPFYNVVILLRMTGKPAWWLALMLVPFANFVVAVLLMMELAKSFGQSRGFGIGLLLLGFIFLPMLAFGSARYLGPPRAGVVPVLATA